MGSFRQHMTCSTAAGVALGGVAYAAGFAPPVCLVSAGLCSFAGMLPDIDSNTSRSFQECIYLASGLGCLLFVQRLRQFGWESDSVILGGVLMFLFIRFAGGGIVRKITSHRGMIHSIPMAVFAGELTFFMTVGSIQDRVLKAAALTLGYLSHLVLDEICSIDSTGRIPRLKKSFGTALKWSDPKRKLSVLLLYTFVICLGYAALTHPEVVERFHSAATVPPVLQAALQTASQTVLPTTESGSTSLPPVPLHSAALHPAENLSAKNNVKNTNAENIASNTKTEAAEFLRQNRTAAEPARKYSDSVPKKISTDISLFTREPPLVPPEKTENPNTMSTGIPAGDSIMMDFP